MSDISDGWQGRLAVAVAPSTGKMMKNAIEFLERGLNLLQTGILNFTNSLSYSPVIVFQI